MPVIVPRARAGTRSAMRALVAGLPQPWGTPETAADSAYRIRITDALIGLPTAALQDVVFVDNGTEFQGQIFF